MDKRKQIRYILSILLLIIMVGLSEWNGEKDIIFPETAALAIGLWIIDKRVWKVKRHQIVLLMTAGAIAGICIVRYSPLPQLCNLCLAFTFAACCLMISRATLAPLLSACMLPVLLHTDTWVYPVAVCLLSVILVMGQKLMEKAGIRQQIVYQPAERNWKKDTVHWAKQLFFIFLAISLSVFYEYPYLIIPPLIVTFAELVNSKAGFRNRPVQILLFLITGISLGTVAQVIGHYYLNLPESVVALFVILCLFAIFEWTGKFFAPAGALALIPLLLPREGLTWLPLQATMGAIFFISIALIVFQQCYKWNRAQLVYCLTPTVLRKYINRKKRESV